MGKAALVIGIVAAVIAFIPGCGIIALLPAIVGLVLGIVELTSKSKTDQPKGMAIAGIVLNAAAIVIVLLWLVIFGATRDKFQDATNQLRQDVERSAQKNRSAPATPLTRRLTTPKESPIPISGVTWEEIDRIYNIRSDFTELQKKEHWKSYKGKKVKWTGTVSSVGETFGTLILQVKLNPTTLTSDVLVRLKNVERSKALKLKEGDQVTFVGTLNDWGTIMPVTLDHGEIVE